MIENSANSSFLSKFKDRTQLVKRQGIISLGVHVVSKKEIPSYKLHQDMLQDKQKLNQTMFQGLERPEIENILKPTQTVSCLKLPILRQAKRKIPEQEFYPMNEKRSYIRSFSKKNQSSLDNLNRRVTICKDSNESKLNRSLIIRY